MGNHIFMLTANHLSLNVNKFTWDHLCKVEKVQNRKTVKTIALASEVKNVLLLVFIWCQHFDQKVLQANVKLDEPFPKDDNGVLLLTLSKVGQMLKKSASTKKKSFQVSLGEKELICTSTQMSMFNAECLFDLYTHLLELVS